MLYVLIALSAIVATFFICRYYAAKTRLVEQEIEKAIARKFLESGKFAELTKVHEENAVMRNLLLDLLENEAILPISQSATSHEDLVKMKTTKIQRYREIIAESRHFLRCSGADHGTGHPSRTRDWHSN